MDKTDISPLVIASFDIECTSIDGSFPNPKRITSPFVGAARETLKCLRTGVDGISSGADGLKALELIFAIYRSSRLQGKRIKLK